MAAGEGAGHPPRFCLPWLGVHLLPCAWGRRFDKAFGMLLLQLLQVVAEPIDVVSELL